MVIGGKVGYVLKCEKCGHRDSVIFMDGRDRFKKTLFKLFGKKCSMCGAKMARDENWHIDF